ALEMRKAAEIGDFFLREPQPLQVLDRLLQSGRKYEIPVFRKPPHEQLKRRALVRLAGLPITGRHRELIEVGDECVHARRTLTSSSDRSSWRPSLLEAPEVSH